MSAKTGNAILKLLIVLAVLAGGVFATLFFLRDTALVAEVLRGPAVDAVPANVEVLADKGLQELKIEGSGRVEKAEFDTGTRFKMSEVLVELDASEIKRNWDERQRVLAAEKARLDALNNNNQRVEVARQDLKNAQRGFDLKRVSDAQVKAAARAVTEAENQDAVLKLALDKIAADQKAEEEAYNIAKKKMAVTAPMAGEIQAVMVAPGTLVNAGATVATFYSMERIVLAKVSEEDFAKVKLDDPAVVQLISLPNQQFAAKVVKILPFADPETRRFTFHLKVEADNSRLLPNSTGEATITTNKRENVLLVPRQALGAGNVLYVVKNGRVERREGTQIEIGFRSLNIVEIVKGVELGEHVIVDRLDQFRDGQRVKVKIVKW